jgi:hypothetical protein
VCDDFAVGARSAHTRRLLNGCRISSFLWATSYGLLGYLLGTNVYQLTGSLGLVLLGLAACVTATLFFLLRRSERRWEAEAERQLPGALEQYLPRDMQRDNLKKKKDILVIYVKLDSGLF